jgi:hypothetical protein
MLIDQFDSRLMIIEVRGSTIRYAYRGSDRSYELRNVAALDIAQLRRTHQSVVYSSSATVQLLTHRYRDAHYHADGRRAKPSRESERSLVPLTPYR